MKQSFKLQKTLLIVGMLLGMPALLQAETLSEAQFSHLQFELAQKRSLITQFTTSNEIENYLQSYSTLKQSYIRHLWLEQLSQQQTLSEPQLNWVNSHLNQQDIIQVSYNDHPNKSIPVVDVAANAKALLKILSLRSTAQDIAKAWSEQTFSWQAYFQDDKYRALLLWVNNHGDKQEISTHFLRNVDPQSLPNNEIVMHLLSANHSEFETQNLLDILLQRPVDEFTYQILQSLPKDSSEHIAVEHLISSTNNDLLSSQAYLLLAKHFPKNEQVQQAIEQGIFSENNKWHAFMALTRMDAPTFKQDVLKRLENQPSDFNRANIELLKNTLQVEGDL